MRQHQSNYELAIAGLAYAMRDWWKASAPAADSSLLLHAERLATGAEPASASSAPGLRSIFDRLRGYAGVPHYVPVGEMDMHAEALYPQSSAPKAGSFELLKQEFGAAAAVTLGLASAQVRLEALLDALQRYAWCAPAPQYGADSDVSLYDHARITAALAVCLADPANTASETALLLGGDLSGVQDWLYTLGSSGAAKSLRGRSFYLQLLTEVIAFKVLDELGLPLTNLIYAGGGNFYVLAPVSAALGFDKLSQQIGAALLDIHDGELYLSMASTSIRADEFVMGAIGAAWNRVNQSLGRQKRQRFANLGSARMAETIGAPLNQGGKPDKVCSVCQRENPKGKPWPADKDDNSVRKCGLCRSLERLGGQLPHASHIIVSRLTESTASIHSIDDWQDGVHALGYHVEAVDGNVATADRHPQSVYARIGRTQPRPDRSLDSQVSYAYDDLPHTFFYRPLVNIVPRKGEEIATFDQLCENAQGIDRWGVLRMDVDDLGLLFRDGFGQRATLTRTTQLSFALRLFFEGHLNAIGQRFNAASHGYDPEQAGAEGGKDKVYAMYSGGDDLFIVGAWDALPHLAHAVHGEFQRYVAENPHLTLSGGISLVVDGFPLYQAARQAGRAEKRAKDFERPNGGHDKDALAFLGQVFGWEQYAEIWGRAAKLQTWSKGGQINRSLIQTLRAIDSEYQAGLIRQQELRAAGKGGQVGQFYYGPWMWKLVYQLSRVAAQTRRSDKQEIGVWVEQLRDDLTKPTGPITTLGLSARWAEYLTRSKPKEQDHARSRVISQAAREHTL
jgi:CRISPR-associated protein Csm1